MNKFNAVVWDSFQVKNNETLAFDFYIHKLFLEKHHLRNTSSNCLLCRVVKDQYPQLQFTWKQSTRSPQNAFSLVPNLKFIRWKELFLPLEKTHTKLRRFLSVCLGNGLVTGPWVKYSWGLEVAVTLQQQTISKFQLLTKRVDFLLVEFITDRLYFHSLTSYQKPGWWSSLHLHFSDYHGRGKRNGEPHTGF